MIFVHYYTWMVLSLSWIGRRRCGTRSVCLFVWCRDLSFGRGRTAPVRGAEMPRAAAAAPWDGRDGELPLEEDIDLSDVDLEKDEL